MHTAGPAKSSTSSSSTTATACAIWKRRAWPPLPGPTVWGALGSSQRWRCACYKGRAETCSRDWVYTAGKSCVTCQDTDVITNVNPYYLAAVTTAAGEANYLRYLGTSAWAACSAQGHRPGANAPLLLFCLYQCHRGAGGEQPADETEYVVLGPYEPVGSGTCPSMAQQLWTDACTNRPPPACQDVPVHRN